MHQKNQRRLNYYSRKLEFGYPEVRIYHTGQGGTGIGEQDLEQFTKQVEIKSCRSKIPGIKRFPPIRMGLGLKKSGG
jgi:hypothetical protein